MTISVYLFPKPYASGEFPVMLQAIHNRRPRYKELFVIAKEYWDPVKKQVSSDHDLYRELNNILKKEVKGATERYGQIVEAGKEVDFDFILGKKTYYDPKKGYRIDKVFSDYLKIHTIGLAPGTQVQYERLIRNLTPIIGHLFTSEFKKDTSSILIAALKPKNNNNTINAKTSFVNQVLEWADEHYDIQTKKMKRSLREIERQPGNLEEEEISQLIDFEDLTQKQKKGKNIFLFQFFMLGSRISDALLMKKSSIAGGRVDYLQKKGQKEMSVKINNQLQRIIDEQMSTPGEYLFDFMEGFMSQWNGEDPKELEKAVVNEIGKINNLLSSIFKRMKSYKRPTSHWARHSFARIADSKRTPVRHIQKGLGHSKLSTTERYLGKLRADEIDDTMALVYQKREK